MCKDLIVDTIIQKRLPSDKKKGFKTVDVI